MIIERIIFNIVAFALFTIIFFKMIRRNDTNYTYVLIAQAIGIAIGFIGLVFRINLPIIVLLFTYIISILLPLTIIISEKRGLFLTEIIYIYASRFYYKNGQEDKAKRILLEIVEKYPNSYYAHKELASIYEKKEEKDISIDEYVKASDLNPSNFELKVKAAVLLKDTNRSDEATRILDEILKEKPDCYEASCALGDILFEKEQYREAINVYLQALNYNPDKYELYYNLGIMFTTINDFQTAKEYYEKAAKLNSYLYHAKFNLAQIALLYNDLEEAQEEFMECLEDESIIDEAYYYLAYISMLKGEKEEAIRYLNTAVEDNIELYEKAQKELVFELIIKQINKPSSDAKKKKTTNLKESLVKKHLEETCEVVGNLNHYDIKVIRKIREREKEQLRKDEEYKNRNDGQIEK